MCSVEKFGDADFNLCGRSIISHNSKGVLGPHFTRVVAGVGPHVLTQGPDVWSNLTEIQRNTPKVTVLICYSKKRIHNIYAFKFYHNIYDSGIYKW